MSQNDDTRDEEVRARYRQASADASGPSDAVRAAILAESRRVAEELAKRAPQANIDVSRPAANDSRWKIPVFGTAGAALLAALLFAPRYWETAPPAQVSMAPQTQLKAEAPRLEEVKPYAAPSYTAPAPIAATPAPAPPASAAQNYAPTTNSIISPLAAARAGLPVMRGAATDSALKPATLDSAVAQGDLKQTALLLDQGAVIDARDEAGRTPLMLAVTQNRLEIVRLLLSRGADPNAADNAGHTPLQQALMRNLRDVTALLEQAGAH
jgi:hypothetical protein